MSLAPCRPRPDTAVRRAGHRPRRPATWRVLGLLLLAATGWLSTASTAGAHGDEGTMTITSATATDGDIRVEVGITYTNDDELAVDATVSAQLVGPAGETVGPVDLPRTGDGAVYAADVAVPSPGAWAVTVTSEGPTATAATTVDVAAPTTTAPTTTAAPEDEAPTTTVEVSGAGDPADDDGDDDGNGMVVGLIVGAVALALLAAFAGWRLSSRGGPGPG